MEFCEPEPQKDTRRRSSLHETLLKHSYMSIRRILLQDALLRSSRRSVDHSDGSKLVLGLRSLFDIKSDLMVPVVSYLFSKEQRLHIPTCTRHDVPVCLVLLSNRVIGFPGGVSLAPDPSAHGMYSKDTLLLQSYALPLSFISRTPAVGDMACHILFSLMLCIVS
jgi:hypothetical protein